MSEKILVGCPTYKGMQYCIDKFLKRIKSLDYPKYDILMVDNSVNSEHFDFLKKVPGIEILKDYNKSDSNMNKVISSRNMIIKYAIERDYDFLLMMDADVIPPKDILKKLLGCKKDIVSGLYYNYFKSSGQLKILPVSWVFLTPKEFDELKKQIVLPPVIKSHLDMRRHLTPEEAKTGKLFEVMIPSAGCMLISRKVFQKVNYGLLEMPEGINADTAEDVYFTKKARDLGFASFCFSEVLCDHLVGGKFVKDSEGKLRHPLH